MAQIFGGRAFVSAPALAAGTLFDRFRAGQSGQASLATAERYALVRLGAEAMVHAERAAWLLHVGSTGWRRAQDIIDAQKRRR